MRAAAAALDLGPRFAETVVDQFRHVLFSDRLVKTRPSGSGIELVRRFEQRQSARGTVIRSVLVIVVVFACVRTLGSLLPHHIKLCRREQLLPFGVGLNDFCAVKFFRRLEFRVDRLGFSFCDGGLRLGTIGRRGTSPKFPASCKYRESEQYHPAKYEQISG